MTYKQALAYPAKSGIGWAHIEDGGPSMQAATAGALARKFCLRPESIYNWAIEQGLCLRKWSRLFLDNPDLLFVCVLNDWGIQQGLDELKDAATD